MNPDIVVHSSVHEVEFWKRYRTLCRMIETLDGRERLIKTLQEETIIPDKTRDEVTGFLKTEYAQDMGAFHDFLVNFISLSMQGLHPFDIMVEFSFRQEGPLLCHRSALHVDDRTRDLPPDEGQHLLSAFSFILDDPAPEKSLLRVYEEYQQRCDRNFSADLNRCMLELRREMYPGSAFHARLRLPAEVFIDEASGQSDVNSGDEQL